jgi:hypothetical protein
LEAVIVPLKVQYKSTLPLTNPKAVVNQKYKADAQSTGFLPIFSDEQTAKLRSFSIFANPPKRHLAVWNSLLDIRADR